MWGAWDTSGGCSVTCGVGERTYTRSCDNPAPSCSGAGCGSDNTMTVSCDEGCCPGKIYLFTKF